MNHALRLLFFVLIVRPLVLILLGLNVRRRDLLPNQGPAVIVANHNSHLDALVLMSLMPLRLLPRLRPVAAADYFLKNRFLRWFSLRILGILPLARRAEERETRDPLAPMVEALDRGEILLLFPEGSRGQPEELSNFHSGVAHLAKRRPDVPTIPIFMHGLGKALPRGEAILVPFFCDLFVGEPLHWTGDKRGYLAQLESTVKGLAEQGHFPEWE